MNELHRENGNAASHVAPERSQDKSNVSMSDKERLMDTLFNRPGKKLLNLKFFRGGREEVSEDRFCAEVNKLIFAIDEGLTKASTVFRAEHKKKINVVELAERLK